MSARGAGEPTDCVMVVEDDHAIRSVLKALLEVEGFRVASARNGREALQQLHAGVRPSLILLDLRMPDMDGVTFRERQRRESELAAIPVVVLSGDRDAGRIAEELGVGCIRKPLELDRLLSTVAQHCAHTGAQSHA